MCVNSLHREIGLLRRQQIQIGGDFSYLGGSIELRISSVCCAFFASIGGSFCLAGGLGTGPPIVPAPG